MSCLSLNVRASSSKLPPKVHLNHWENNDGRNWMLRYKLVEEKKPTRLYTKSRQLSMKWVLPEYGWVILDPSMKSYNLTS